MGQTMPMPAPAADDLKDMKTVKSPLRSPLKSAFGPDVNTEMNLKNHKVVVPQGDIWRQPISAILQTTSVACAFGAVVLQPKSLAASLNGTMCAATFVCSWLPQPLEVPVRVVAAASLATTAFAICNADAITLYTALLGIGGTTNLLNLGRVIIYEPQQGKGLVQLALVLPAAAGIGLSAGPGLMPWNPILMSLGASTLAVGMSLQLTNSQSWIYTSLKTAGCTELMAGLAVPFINQILTHQVPFKTVYESVCAMALVGLMFQSAFSVPVMCGAKERRDINIFHQVMSRINFMMSTMAMVTSFALQYGWSGAPTVACALVCGGSGSLLMTSAWEYTGAAELSL